MKLSTFLLCAIFICTFPRIQAFDRVYRPAEIIHAGDTLSGSKLPPNLNTLTINYRVRCKKIKPSASPRKLWKVIWCATSDHDFYEAEISYGSTAYGSVADDPALIIDINRIVGGACQSLHSSQLTTGVSTSHGANSLDIDLWNGRIYVRIGNGNTYTTLCDFEFESPSTLSGTSIIAYEEIELIRERISALGDHRHAPADIDRLNIHLSRQDTEPVEGYWFYYDRTMPISKTKLGGYYSLAVVRSDVIPEAYDIIYLDGAETNADSWTSGALKGRLHQSGFENEFDLQWFDADQRPAGIENSASLLNQGSTLQLNFPSLETQLRFRRNPNCLLVADPE